MTQILGGSVVFTVDIHSDFHRSITWIKGRCSNDLKIPCTGEKIEVMEKMRFNFHNFMIFINNCMHA